MKKQNFTYYKVTKFNNFKEMLDIAVKEAGDKIAFKYKEGKDEIVEVTYSQFQQQTEWLGAALTEMGFADKHIACIGKNSYKWVLTYLTVLKSSGVYVPVDNELTSGDILHVLNDSECSVVFYTQKHEELFMTNTDKLPNVKLFIGFDRTEDNGNFLSFDKLIEYGKKCDVEKYRALESDPHALKMLVYTSGTTGSSKGVMLSEHNLVSSVYYGLQVSTVYDTCLSVLPYHHTYEAVSGILVSLHKHSTICINDSLTNVMKNLQLYKPSYIYLVPAFVQVMRSKILKNIKESGKEKAFNILLAVSNALRKIGIDLRKVFFKSIHDAFGGRLRKIVCGGAPIRPEIGKFFEDIGISLINGYGITECSPLVSANHDMFNDYHTAGIKLPCIDLRIDNPNEEGIGEICVKGDVVMLGYYKQPEKTAEVMKDGWFSTGDYGYINDKGQLVITGRKKNIIVLNNGKNIYPEEIESIIQEIDYINEVVVRGLFDENGEQKSLMAEVFLSEEKTPDEVLKDIRKVTADLPVYKQITKVVIRSEEFEKTTSKKIKR
ncbi:AMP-binding protein [Acetivibrio clariflavus]|uniref:AMP-forming long-chain acyl-CoA synthetase n=1 Tax=Acetivibrio clariflavus (strain DSM 19732 / NBRC 101661 / EBR45) TaxID=720554 RepID=G8M387_ACECE|nr:AMP-binding protein [Acetivibrio clariflavus]AEV70407.1 AMP-forming long-chain acyl-CoA synthetase [Acetivibrio clariflavus DSM 19732]